MQRRNTVLGIDLSFPLVWTAENFLSPYECSEIINQMEAYGFSDAPVTTEMGPIMLPSIRNNNRVIIDDLKLAKTLYEKIQPHVPVEFLGMNLCGVNERFRCYRYNPGQKFAPHLDGYFARNENERSFLTFMVYLNDNFEGGETSFLEIGQTITPKTGTALFFQHPILHEGRQVTKGVKYALRSDIMYSK